MCLLLSVASMHPISSEVNYRAFREGGGMLRGGQWGTAGCEMKAEEGMSG